MAIAVTSAAFAQGRPAHLRQGYGGPPKPSAKAEARPLRPQATGVRALANVRELHDILISPASDAVFDASAANPPGDDKAWAAARVQALLLAESGNLLMLGTRVRDNGPWMNMSRALVEAAALAATAAQNKDAKGLETATDAITVACMECHRPYRDQGRQMGAPK